MGILHEDQYTFMIIYRPVLLEKCFRQNLCRKSKYTFYIQLPFFPPEIMPFMRWCGKILYKQTGHMTIRCMHIAFWMPKATNTLRICNMCCFSPTSLSYVHCLYWFYSLQFQVEDMSFSQLYFIYIIHSWCFYFLDK
jgi:hypothetical protein